MSRVAALPTSRTGRTRRHWSVIAAGAVLATLLAVASSGGANAVSGAASPMLARGGASHQLPALYVKGVGRIRAHVWQFRSVVDRTGRLHVLSTARDGVNPKPTRFRYDVRNLRTRVTTTTRLRFPWASDRDAGAQLSLMPGGRRLATLISACGSIYTSTTRVQATRLVTPAATGIDGSYCGDDLNAVLKGTIALGDGRMAILVERYTTDNNGTDSNFIQLYVGRPGQRFHLIADDLPGAHGTDAKFDFGLGKSLNHLQVLLYSHTQGYGEYLSHRTPSDAWSTPLRIVKTSNPSTTGRFDQLQAYVRNHQRLILLFMRTDTSSSVLGLYSATASPTGTPSELRRIPHTGSIVLTPPSLAAGPHHRTYLLFMRGVTTGRVVEEIHTKHGWAPPHVLVQGKRIAAADLVPQPGSKAPLIIYLRNYNRTA